MRIRGWSIDGFGHFRDYEVGPIGDGLTVFHGPNEAGKTTLLAFVRGMLFGFPDRRSRDSRYEPLRGGRHGGRLRLEIDGEPWTIERDLSGRGHAVVRVVTPRGEGGEEDLRRALGSADARLFRSVFAFSLTELQSFSTLSDEGARSRIFSAGIVGAGRAARHVIAEISDRADALFKPRGRTQTIPALLKQLADRRQATTEARRAARAYPDLVREEESSLAEKQRLDAAVLAARRAVRQLDELVGLWAIWSDLHGAETQYGALEAIDTFPDDSEHRLADVTSRLEAARARHAELVAECERTDVRVTTCRGETRTDLAALAPEVAAHYETRDLYRSNASRLQAMRLELAHETEALASALRLLGDNWDEQRLLAFDVSLPHRERVRSWGNQLRQAADALQQVEREHTADINVLEEAERSVAEAAEQLEHIGAPEPDVLSARDGALRRLRIRLAELRDHQHAAEWQEAVRRERERSLELLEPETSEGAPPGGPPWSVPLAIVLIGLLTAAALYTVRPVVSIIAAVLFVALGLGVAAWIRRSRSLTATELATRRREQTERRRAIMAEATEAREAAERARQETDRVRALVARDAAILDLPAQPTAADLEDADRALAQLHQQASLSQQCRRALSDAERRYASLRDRASAAALRTDQARAVLRSGLQEWSDWLRTAGIADDMTPDGVLDLIPAVHRAREHQRAREKLRGGVEALAAEVHAWEEHTRQLLSRANVSLQGSATGAGALVDALHTLHQRSAAARTAQDRLAAAEDDLRACRAKLDAMTPEVARWEVTRAALLAEAGARDEVHYRARMQTFGERQRLRREIDRLHRQLTIRIGEGSEAEAVRATLATGAIGEWARERDRHEGEAGTLEHELEAAIRAHRDAERRREVLAMSADIAKCEAEEQALLSELNDTVDRWRALALARALTETTLHEYVRTRQPAVIAGASGMFATVTDGAYTELRQDESGEGLSVVTRRGSVLGPEQLSRGTAEQLYLCLRLALAAEFGSHGAKLPLVMDDVCVNFDPERARAVASVLRDVAAEQQIILFTCQPTTVDTLTALMPELRVHTMPRYGPRTIAAQEMAGTP